MIFKKENKERGFTLIELMVAISITAVLGTIGIAGFISFNKNQVLETSAQSVATMLNLAKSRAQSQIKPESLCLKENTLNGYLVEISENRKYTLYLSCSIGGEKKISGQDKALPSDLIFDSNPSFFFPVQTGGLSIPSGENAVQVVIKGYGKTKTIIVNSLGGVSIQGTASTSIPTPTNTPISTPIPTSTPTLLTPTPVPTSTPTPTIAPTPAPSWSYPRDFYGIKSDIQSDMYFTYFGFYHVGSTQNTTYYSATNGSYKKATWDDSCYVVPDSDSNFCISYNRFVPSWSNDAVIRWTASFSGNISIKGTVKRCHDTTSCVLNNGLNNSEPYTKFYIRKNQTTTLQSWELNDNSTVYAINLVTSVTIGDKIEFWNSAANGDSGYDDLDLDATITSL